MVSFPFLFSPFFKGADSLLDVSSETDQQDLLLLLQAKVASLTLHNKELQDKLQVCISVTLGANHWVLPFSYFRCRSGEIPNFSPKLDQFAYQYLKRFICVHTANF